MGGETLAHSSLEVEPAIKGLSPRGRGNHRGSIPSPPSGSIPRVGGETVEIPPGRLVWIRQNGSIPAWAGKPELTGTVTTVHMWSIPAWAGKPHGGRHVPGVYPRVGGETVVESGETSGGSRWG